MPEILSLVGTQLKYHPSKSMFGIALFKGNNYLFFKSSREVGKLNQTYTNYYCTVLTAQESCGIV